MDNGEVKAYLTEFLKKYRWALLVVLLGVLLMSLKAPEAPEPVSAAQPVGQEPSFSQELEEILSGLEGAGKVRVLLSTVSGPETIYQTSEDLRTTPEARETRQEPVILSSADRSEAGLVRRVDSPVYLGAVVLCQGAESAKVRLAVVDTVAKATGLTSDKIAVWKMK